MKKHYTCQQLNSLSEFPKGKSIDQAEKVSKFYFILILLQINLWQALIKVKLSIASNEIPYTKLISQSFSLLNKHLLIGDYARIFRNLVIQPHS